MRSKQHRIVVDELGQLLDCRRGLLGVELVLPDAEFVRVTVGRVGRQHTVLDPGHLRAAVAGPIADPIARRILGHQAAVPWRGPSLLVMSSPAPATETARQSVSIRCPGLDGVLDYSISANLPRA